MRTRWLALACIVAFAVTVAAQEGEQPAMDPQTQAMMAAMEKYATPGPEHERLVKGNGTWDVTSKMWMDPSGEPMESEGVSTQRSILGGRYVQYDYEGDMMGMPFSGLLWNLFFLRSDSASAYGIAELLPKWFAPPADSHSYID